MIARYASRARSGLHRLLGALALLATVGLFALPASASAFTEPGFTGTFNDFAGCQANLPELRGCLHSFITGGVIEIGHATVPISVPGDTLDLGFYHEGSAQCEAIDLLDAAAAEGCVASGSHGILGGPAQPVPGGLLGSIGADEMTDVRARLEWAKEVSADSVFGVFTEAGFPDATLNEIALQEAMGVGLQLAVKVHLMNPFLGPGCYIGSASEPLTLRLTTGITSPPPPQTPITGRRPELATNDTGEIALLTELVLVDNSFSAPAATGCGSLMDAAIDETLGLPSPAGENAVVIDAEADQASTEVLLENGWSEEWGETAAKQPPASEPETVTTTSAYAEPTNDPAPAPFPPAGSSQPLAPSPLPQLLATRPPAAKTVGRPACARHTHSHRAPKACAKHRRDTSDARHRTSPGHPGRR